MILILATSYIYACFSFNVVLILFVPYSFPFIHSFLIMKKKSFIFLKVKYSLTACIWFGIAFFIYLLNHRMHIHVSLINIYKYILEWNWVTDLIDCWTHTTIPFCVLKLILKSFAQICLISRDMPPKVSQVSSPKRVDTKKRFLDHHKPHNISIWNSSVLTRSNDFCNSTFIL